MFPNIYNNMKIQKSLRVEQGITLQMFPNIYIIPKIYIMVWKLIEFSIKKLHMFPHTPHTHILYEDTRDLESRMWKQTTYTWELHDSMREEDRLFFSLKIIIIINYVSSFTISVMTFLLALRSWYLGIYTLPQTIPHNQYRLAHKIGEF